MTQDNNSPFDAQDADDFEIDLGTPEPAPDLDEVEIDLGFGDAEEADDELALNLGDEVVEEAEEAGADASAAEQAALDELHQRLRLEAGDWYVIHTYSGMENRVKQNLDNRVKTLGMEDYIYEAVVPTEEVTETRNGTKKSVTRSVSP